MARTSSRNAKPAPKRPPGKKSTGTRRTRKVHPRTKRPKAPPARKPHAAKRPKAQPARKPHAAKRPRTARPAAALEPAYRNPELPAPERARDLVSRMSLQEKVSQLMSSSPAIPRLGVPAYFWQCEGIHGVGRAGIATVFPQCIGLAATFDVGLLSRVAAAISDEARAKHHDMLRKGIVDIYTGLTYWSPNINIFRDPRWGRGHETYGECPYLTSRMGVAYVKAMQGDDLNHLKLASTPKHFAAHSGPEAERHGFNAMVDERDLRETYLPAFKACVMEGKAASIMGAYNRLNDEACCASESLLRKLLRQEWGFEGYVVSDCGAIADIYRDHGVARDAAEASARAMKAGCDLECGDTYRALVEAVAKGLISEADVDRAAERVFQARFKLGMFDPPERVRWAQVPVSVIDCSEHRELNRQAARETIVLLKNRSATLPLSDTLKRILVVGPNADDIDVLVGNYNGAPSEPKTILRGIRRAASAQTEIVFRKGCGHVNMDLAPREVVAAYRGWRSPAKTKEPAGNREPPGPADLSVFADVVQEARSADAVIAVVGLSPEMEGEQGEGEERTTLALPVVQQRLLEALSTAGKPLVVVLLGGSALSVGWAAEHADAILMAWYPGGEGGDAVADVLFGKESPAGRLPVTFYQSEAQLPPFRDYRMEGRTYRYFRGEPLWPFGFGLSYTTFAYSDLRVEPPSPAVGQRVKVSVVVRNTGKVPADEVVQLYLTNESATVPTPIRQLAGFVRTRLAPTAHRRVDFTFEPAQLSWIEETGKVTPSGGWNGGPAKGWKRIVAPARYLVSVGGCQPATKPSSTSGEPLAKRFKTVGPAKVLPL